MVRALANASKATYLTVRDAADEAYSRAWGILLKAGILIFVMWVCNAWIAKEVNYCFFFLGLGGLTFVLFSPKAHIVSMLLGGTINGLNDKDITEGAVNGISVLYRVAKNTLFFFCWVAGLLSTWSFKEAPGNFWPLVAMLTIVALASSYAGWHDRKWFAGLTICYALVVCGMSMYSTLSTDTKGTLGEAMHSISAHTQSSSAPVAKSAKQALSEYGVKHRIDLEPNEVSEAVFVQLGDCLSARDPEPDQNGFTAEVRLQEVGAPWVKFDIWKKEHPNIKPTWTRFRANGKKTYVEYTITEGLCK